MKRGVVLLLIVIALAAAVYVVRALPPGARALTAPTGFPPSVRGAIHIHTRRSDGTGLPNEVAAAAARAGLHFIILTDHDDAATEPTKPYYHQRVLIIEGAEISADGGHVVALGLPRAPYPLAGEARDVLEDVRRLGGLAIAAHPESPKPDLRWVEWAGPFDGLEWLNGDSEWRDESSRALLRALASYPFRRPETLAALLDRPDGVLRRWDVLTARRRVVAVAASDAHARIGLRSGEPDDDAPALHLPSYEAMFRTLSITVTGVSLTGDAAADAGAVLTAIRAGHVYSTIDALASPAAVSVAATAGGTTFAAGDIVPPGQARVELRVESNAPGDATTVLLRNGMPLTTAPGGRLTHIVTGERAAYRAEIRLAGAPGQPPVPWVLSNPVYVGYGAEPRPPVRPPATEFASQYDNGFAPDWTIESSPRSVGALDVTPALGGTQLSMRWGLGGTLSESPYAAMAMPAGPALSGYDRLLFTARADRPMRMSVQLRVPNSGDGERWHRSVYLDETAREVTVFFDDMTARGPTSRRRPNLSDVRHVLFVVDTVNTRPGTSGQIWIDDVRYGR